jgi:hypothetical protein
MSHETFSRRFDALARESGHQNHSFVAIVATYTDEELAWALKNDRDPRKFAQACDAEANRRAIFEAFETMK